MIGEYLGEWVMRTSCCTTDENIVLIELNNGTKSVWTRYDLIDKVLLDAVPEGVTTESRFFEDLIYFMAIVI